MAPKGKQTETAVNPFAELVVEVRKTLGSLTQKHLADALGLTVTTIARWEMRSNISLQSLPILKILALLADDRLRQKFALQYEIARQSIVLTGNGDTLSEDYQNLLRNHSDAATGINILFELAQAGNEGAAKTLSDLAAEINRKAGNWRKLKYLKK